LVLIGGLFQPNCAAISGLVYIIGRQMYATGYNFGGAFNRIRLLGAGLQDIGLVLSLGTAVYGLVKVAFWFTSSMLKKELLNNFCNE